MKKIFHYDSEVCTELVTKFSNFIATLEAEDEILIQMNSNGGSVVAGFALYDLLNSCPNHKTVNIIGMCASAATYILMAADNVVMQPTATLMCHEVQGWLGGTPREIARDLQYMEDLQTQMINLYAKKAKYIDIAKIEEMVENTTYMTAQQALDYGFVDEVPGLTRNELDPEEEKEEEQEEPKEEPKDEGIVNRILSIFAKIKPDDIIKAPTDAEIAQNEEITRLHNELSEKDMELENLHKSLTLKEEEFNARVAETEARLAEQAQSFNAERDAKEAEYENKLKNLEDAVQTEIANRLAALGYDANELPAPSTPANNKDLNVYDKLMSEMRGR